MGATLSCDYWDIRKAERFAEYIEHNESQNMRNSLYLRPPNIQKSQSFHSASDIAHEFPLLCGEDLGN